MSVTQTVRPAPIAALLACPSCAGTRVSTVAMTLTDGSPAIMCACRSCEKTTWCDQFGGLLPLQLVLNRATKPGAAGLDLLARSSR